MPIRGPLRVLVLMHDELVPPDDPAAAPRRERERWQGELDVLTALRELGHEARALGVQRDLDVLGDAIRTWRPDIAFNLLEEFHGVCVYDQHVVSFLELMRVPYTGCNPRGLTLARDKALCKKVLSWHRIAVPRFAVYPAGRRVTPPRGLAWPLFVKSVHEEASLGIAQASIVHSAGKLADRVAFVHEQLGTDALVEEYIDGRELYVGLLGNGRVTQLPAWELSFDRLPADSAPIATSRVKWDRRTQQRLGVRTGPALNLPDPARLALPRICRQAWDALGLSGYARIDLRLTPDGQLYLLEANPNPNLQADEDFAAAAGAAGTGYPALIGRLLDLGLRHRVPWKLGIGA